MVICLLAINHVLNKVYGKLQLLKVALHDLNVDELVVCNHDPIKLEVRLGFLILIVHLMDNFYLNLVFKVH